eukprot:9508692-Ditylum_brightwellii.AAC.1
MLPYQIGSRHPQGERNLIFLSLSMCWGILRFLFLEINTRLIVYGIFTHTAHCPILYAISRNR